MGKIVFEHSNEIKEITDGLSIIEACEEAGIPFACTEGICGTCVIEVTQGGENLSPFTTEEQDFFGVENKERLACQCRLLGGSIKIKC